VQPWPDLAWPTLTCGTWPGPGLAYFSALLLLLAWPDLSLLPVLTWRPDLFSVFFIFGLAWPVTVDLFYLALTQPGPGPDLGLSMGRCIRPVRPDLLVRP
jgi:hypothetical protein